MADAVEAAGRTRPYRYWVWGRLTSRRAALALASLTTVIGIATLLGWCLNQPVLTGWLPGLAQTKVNAAICFTLIGSALILGLAPVSPGRRLVSSLLAVAVAALAVSTLLEHVTGVDLRIDQLFFADTASAISPHPGRLAVQTGVAFVAAAIGVLALGRRVGPAYVTELLGLCVGVVGAISTLGYLYGASLLLSVGSATQVSLPAAVALLAMSVALVAADDRHLLVRLWGDTGIAGDVTRRILPAAVLVIPAGAWLRDIGQRAGLYDESIGLSIMVAFEALVLAAVGAWTTSRVHRLEAERREALVDLIRLGAAASTPLIERAPVGLAVLDRDLRYLYVNPALAAIGGVPQVASLGQSIDHLIPAFGGDTYAALGGVVAGGESVRDIEVSGQPRQGGTNGTWLLSAEALRDSTGDVVGLALSVVDISERKNREDVVAALTEAQRQAQAIGESIPFGIWVADPDGKISYLSRPFLAITGQTIDEARKFGWLSKLEPETVEDAEKAWAETVATSVPWDRELVVRGPDGRRHTILSRGFPVRDESGAVTSLAGINLDITERKEAEAYREAFLEILSHELGTPITSIYAASTLLSRSGNADPRLNELAEDIGHESERLRRLMEDLVVLARAERGVLQVHIDPVPLQHVLRRTCEQQRRRWPRHTISLTVAPWLPVARAEESFVEQIVRNLLENAVKYAPPAASIEVLADSSDGCPRVRVLDRGPGIDPAEAEKLFEVFYRSPRTSRVAGSGIGLFIAHRLIESMGGSIWARPRDDGQGAEFGFLLQPYVEDGS